MVSERQNVPARGKIARASGRVVLVCVCGAATLGIGACADIWGFDDLGGSASGGRGGGGGGAAGSAGNRTGGGGGAGIFIPVDDAGTGSPTGAGGSTDQGGATGAGGSSPGIGGTAGGGEVGGGGAAGGAGGQAGSGGTSIRGDGSDTDSSVDAGGPGGSGGTRDGGDRADADAAPRPDAQEGGGLGGTVDAGACIPGTSRCLTGALQTCSPAGVWQTTGTVPPRELLANPSFEQGEDPWDVSVAGNFPIVYAADGTGNNTPDIAAQSAPNLVWIGGYNRADDMISQSITLPAAPASMTVSFYYAVVTRETAAGEVDVMDAQIIAGTQTITLLHLSDETPVDNFTRFTAPIPSALAGQTVTLRFHGTTNGAAITSFYIDTTAIEVVACP